MTEKAVIEQRQNVRLGLYNHLDAIVRAHRVTIAVVFPLVGGIILIASAEGWLPAPLAFNPLLVIVGVAVMRTPLITGLLPVLDRRVIGGIALVAGYAYLIEYIGVQTGVPYGAFSYGVILGPMIGGIPIALPLLFIPLVLNAYLVCLLVLNTRARWIVVASAIPTLVLMDVVLDPAAVALGFWGFPNGGVFYDVPLSNYLGWVLSAIVSIMAVSYVFDERAVRDRLATCPYILDDLVSFVILWGAINAWFGHWIPVFVAVVLTVLLGYGMLQTPQRHA